MNTQNALTALTLGVVVFVLVRVALTSGGVPLRLNAEPTADAGGIHRHDWVAQPIAEVTRLSEPAALTQSSDSVDLEVQPSTHSTESPPSQLGGEEERQFKWLRETTDPDYLLLESTELARTLHGACHDEAFRMLDAGEYEVLPPNGHDSDMTRPGPERQYLVDYYAKEAGGRPVRMTISESEFPEAYRIKRQMNWLRDLIHQAAAHD